MNAPSSASTAEARLRDNYTDFEKHVQDAERLLAERRFDEAAMSAACAAWLATKRHPGVFASERLERVLHAVAATLRDPSSAVARPQSATDIKRILHVVTEVPPVGGLTRLVRRWIDTDHTREHSLVVTRDRGSLPEYLTDAVRRSGGSVFSLNHQLGNVRDWAQQLRQLSRDYDLVVLDINCEDVVPVIAFAGTSDIPPVIAMNHADHLFWLGSSICHGVLNLRDAAADITTGRRGVAPERSLMLPTPVEAPVRNASREAARKAIGVEDDSVVMISVARGAKYRPIDGMTYADRFVDLLNENPNAKMFVVGSGMPEGWDKAAAKTGGRIIGIPERPDPWEYFEAADIYIDSYPFSSSTSLMEAAGYGLPLVTLFKAPDEARLVGINHLGLIGGIHQARSDTEWQEEIVRLIRDKAYRAERSKLALKAVAVTHPEKWMQWLERAYQAAAELPPLPADLQPMPGQVDQPHFGEPDIRHEDMYGSNGDVNEFIKDFTGLLPFGARFRTVRHLQQQGKVGGLAALKLLVPEWMKRRLSR